MKAIREHSLVRTLVGLRGNPRACIYTEPLWGIPFALYGPFAGVFMVALGLSGRQIGIVASVLLFMRAVFSVLGGVLTDKLGRKRATFIFDVLAWSVPCLIWAFSQNFWWFVVAAAFNGVQEVTSNSWHCLLVEDADKKKLVDIYAWVHISQMLSVFFAPLAGLLISEAGLVLAVRIMYIFSFASMTLKFVILNKYADETAVGKVRMTETVGQSIFKLLAGYRAILVRLFRSPGMRLTVIATTLLLVTGMVNNLFFNIYATHTLGIQEEFLAYFPIIRAGIMLLFFFVIQPKMDNFGLKVPMLLGVSLYLATYLLLVFIPIGNLSLPLFLTCIFIDSCANGLVLPRRDALQALFIDPQERARLNSVLAAVTMIVSFPFGFISGMLSDMDTRYPFILTTVVFVLLFVVLLTSGALAKKNVRAVEAERELTAQNT